MVSWKEGEAEENLSFTCIPEGVLNVSCCGDKDERGERVGGEFFFFRRRLVGRRMLIDLCTTLHLRPSLFFKCLIRIGVESESNSELQKEGWLGHAPDSGDIVASD